MSGRRHPAHYAAIAFVVTFIFVTLMLTHPEVPFSFPLLFGPPIGMAVTAYAVAWFILQDK